MATLTNTKIKDTYQGLIKTNSNSVVSGTNQYLTDGFGNVTPLSVGTSNIGIGTTSPSSKLQISGSGTQKIRITSTDGANADLSCDGTSSMSLGSPNGIPIRFVNNNTEKMRITSSGNVGIGTTSPTYKLDVTGTGRFTSTLAVQGTGNSYFAGNLGIGTTSPSALLHLRQSTGNTDILMTELDTNTECRIRNSNGILILDSDLNSELGSSGFWFNVDGSERMRIQSDGNVGIGTTSPTYKLDVNGTGRFTGSLTVQDRITQSRDFSGDNSVVFSNTNSAGYGLYSQGGTASRYGFYFVDYLGNTILFGTSGKVSIGNTNNTYNLDVSGTGRFTSSVTANNYITSSDVRLKTKIKDINETDFIDVNWKTFEMITESNQKRYGVIAQELELTNPEFVITGQDGFKSVAYTDLLIAKIAELEIRLKTLEN